MSLLYAYMFAAYFFLSSEKKRITAWRGTWSDANNELGYCKALGHICIDVKLQIIPQTWGHVGFELKKLNHGTPVHHSI